MLEETAKSGKCIILSAPSGAGKTTIVHYLLGQDLGLEFSVSACSRPPRTKEIHGKDYFFYSVEDFRRMIEEDAFVEWEEVYHDMYYGTLKAEIRRIWDKGKAVIFDVDVIGGLNLKKSFGENALAIFVQPPSIETLEYRLRDRSTESEEKIQLRMSKARQELAKAADFDYILINDHLKDACREARDLVSDFLQQT